MQLYVYMLEIQLDTLGTFATSRNHDTILAADEGIMQIPT